MGSCASIPLSSNLIDEMKDSGPERQKTIVYLKNNESEEFESLNV